MDAKNNMSQTGQTVSVEELLRLMACANWIKMQ